MSSSNGSTQKGSQENPEDKSGTTHFGYEEVRREDKAGKVAADYDDARSGWGHGALP